MTEVKFSAIYQDSYKVICDITEWLNDNVGDYQWRWAYWCIGSVTAWIDGVDFINEDDAMDFINEDDAMTHVLFKTQYTLTDPILYGVIPWLTTSASVGKIEVIWSDNNLIEGIAFEDAHSALEFKLRFAL